MLAKQRFGQIVGSNIKKIRNEKDLSQEELADNCGLYRTYINLVETAKRIPSSFTLYKIARGLDVSVSELYPKSSQK